MANSTDTTLHKEYIADLLKERIYATLALLAVLISIDVDHYSPTKALLLVYGTIISLWAASLVAAQMSRRVVFGSELDIKTENEHQLRRHAPMLATLAFPTLMIGLSMTGLVSLGIAVDISIISALLLLVAWSVSSAKSLHITKLPIFLLVIIELLIGLGVVGLKVLIGH
jgi:hypothetical protein